MPTTDTTNLEVTNLSSNALTYTASASGAFIALTNVIQLKPTTEYTIKFSRTSTASNNQWMLYDYDNGTYSLNYRDDNVGTLEKTFTTNSLGQIALGFGVRNATGTGTVSNIMINEGSTAMTYEPYQSQSYEINLGKNLFDKNNPNILNAYLNNDGTTSANSIFRVSDYIDVSGLSDITISGSNGNSEICCFYDGNKTFVSNFGMGTLTTKTASVPNNAKYLRVTLNSSVLDQYQVESGKTVSSYAPYFEPIELCKIGTYKDKIYKDSGKWYLRKEIGKVVLNGSHNGLRTPTSTSGNYRHCVDIGTDIVTEDANTTAPFYCDKLIPTNRNQSYAETVGIAPTDSAFNYKSFIIYTNETKAMTFAEFQTWLSTNNIIVYYPLATATNTEITNENLISQLEAVKLLSGTQNNFTIDADTLPTLNLNYIEEANPHL